METTDGYFYDNGTATLQKGLKCLGVVKPQRNTTENERPLYDVIIVGAGYAGLTACRDLCVAGFNVLLLEARDRIGGRTYTADVDGHLYEMGGTWVHWNQPHTYREMSRYGLTALLPSHGETAGCNYLTMRSNGQLWNMHHGMKDIMLDRAFSKLCDVDGRLGHEVMPFPHDPHQNPEVKRWEQMSVAQRLAQIQSDLTPDEIALLQSFLSSISGADMEKTGLFDVLRWWALGGYSTRGLYETGDEFKIPTGQSSFARCFFEEALRTKKLGYAFKTAVTSIQDQGNQVVVNRTWAAKRLICTIPLNVLATIDFEPGLSPSKVAAARAGHINQGAKFHLEVSGPSLRSWSGASWPAKRVFHAAGDGLTTTGNTHLVCFGSSKDIAAPEEDARDFARDCKALHRMEVRKTVWHDWCKDPFSRGSWCMFPPSFSFDYLEALQETTGSIFFANADWAYGWRGYIDGAIEQGTRAAKTISSELGSRWCAARL